MENENIAVSLLVNGTHYEVLLEPRVSLLDALRETLHLTGTKKRVQPRGLWSLYRIKDVAMSAMEFSAEAIRERMSGNLCRCGAYNGIVEAIRETFAQEVNS